MGPPKAPGFGRRRACDNVRVPKDTVDAWDALLAHGDAADVRVVVGTNAKDVIPAHSNLLKVASPVLRHLLVHQKATLLNYIHIPGGVSYHAVRLFIRFLYCGRYEEQEMHKWVMHVLVLSHSYCVPSLKTACAWFVEHRRCLSHHNVVDFLQLSRACDAPRLSLLCLRLILRDFKPVSATQAWKVMTTSNPALEQEILESLVEAHSRKQERLRKAEEHKVYSHLNEAMEALVHICRDGCRSREGECGFAACKSIGSLVRHFSSCSDKARGCVHCNRMWQLLELHSRMCTDHLRSCKVPLCTHFKDKLQHQTNKDQTKWKVLASKVIAAGNTAPLRARRFPLSSSLT